VRVDARTSQGSCTKRNVILAAVLLFPGTFVLFHVFLSSLAVVALYLLSFLLFSPRSLRLGYTYLTKMYHTNPPTPTRPVSTTLYSPILLVYRGQ
jgi:hypothetical protein